MKNISKILVIAFLAVTSVLFTSCNPETILAKNLEGTWDITSFTIDGVELIGAGLNSGEFEFEEYDGSEGDFELTFINSAGQTIKSTGEYELNSDGDEIDLNYDTGEREEYDIDLEDDEVTLEANFAGELYIIRADKN